MAEATNKELADQMRALSAWLLGEARGEHVEIRGQASKALLTAAALLDPVSLATKASGHGATGSRSVRYSNVPPWEACALCEGSGDALLTGPGGGYGTCPDCHGTGRGAGVPPPKP